MLYPKSRTYSALLNPKNTAPLMRTLKASLLYFAAVFGVGFVLGTIRVLFVVPQVGVRWAELLETPLMLLACFYFARTVVRRVGPFTRVRCLAIGAVALALLFVAEILLIVALQGQTLAQYLASRDPVSGVAYLVSLIMFALMPLLVGNEQGTDS